jgi:hypothetical protein
MTFQLNWQEQVTPEEFAELSKLWADFRTLELAAEEAERTYQAKLKQIAKPRLVKQLQAIGATTELETLKTRDNGFKWSAELYSNRRLTETLILNACNFPGVT